MRWMHGMMGRSEVFSAGHRQVPLTGAAAAKLSSPDEIATLRPSRHPHEATVAVVDGI